ncbi:transposase [Nocardia sp. R7R-8]|uniref:transposase n=1 Tax=Nocardia sp. R7R-8 TaxID=3459304 RepID=UPI00403D6BA1
MRGIDCGQESSARPPTSTGSVPKTPSLVTTALLRSLPVWSSNRARHRLSRTGNRQLSAAIHRIALTQARCHPDARALLARRKPAVTAEWKRCGSSNADSPT